MLEYTVRAISLQNENETEMAEQVNWTKVKPCSMLNLQKKEFVTKCLTLCTLQEARGGGSAVITHTLYKF